MTIAVFVNPRSRANRRNPRVAAEFQAIVGDDGRVFAPQTLEELDEAAAALRAAPPTVIAVHGGDGTLHRTLTALGRAFGERAAPAPRHPVRRDDERRRGVAGHPRAADAFLRRVVADARAGRPLETLRRRCLRVGEPARLHLRQRPDGELPRRVLRHRRATARRAPPGCCCAAFCSAMIGGPFVRRLFKRFEGTVRVDGVAARADELRRAWRAGTVREVGLGFKLDPPRRR